jgi:hypothetical protein
VADLRVTPELWFDRRLLVSGGDAVTMLPYPGHRTMRRQAVRVRQARPTPSPLGAAATPLDCVRTGDRAWGPDKTEDAIKQGNVSAAHGAVVYQIVVTWLRNGLRAER